MLLVVQQRVRWPYRVLCGWWNYGTRITHEKRTRSSLCGIADRPAIITAANRVNIDKPDTCGHLHIYSLIILGGCAFL